MTKSYLLLLPLFLIVACKSPSKAFNQGNYTSAIELAVRKLQKDPQDGEARHILQNAYTYAVNQHEEKIRTLSQLSTDNRWEQLYHQYQQLQQLYSKIHEAPAAVQAVKPVSYASYVTTYGDKSAEARVQRAERLMNNDAADKATYREAFYELRAALNFKPADATIQELLREAHNAATVTILVVPMDVNGSTRYNTSYAFRNFEANLFRAVRTRLNSEFLDFVTPQESRSTRVQPDEIVELRLGAFSIGRPYDDNQTRTVSKEVVVKETVYSKDSVVKEYAKVHARITTTKRLLVSTSDLYIDIRNPDRRTLWNDNIRTEHHWETAFATYTGDERALSDADKALLNKRPETPPREEAIVDQLLAQLSSEATQRLRTFYGRY